MNFAPLTLLSGAPLATMWNVTPFGVLIAAEPNHSASGWKEEDFSSGEKAESGVIFLLARSYCPFGVYSGNVVQRNSSRIIRNLLFISAREFCQPKLFHRILKSVSVLNCRIQHLLTFFDVIIDTLFKCYKMSDRKHSIHKLNRYTGEYVGIVFLYPALVVYSLTSNVYGSFY